MPRVFERDGKWFVDLFVRGKRFRKKIGTRQQAERELKNLMLTRSEEGRIRLLAKVLQRPGVDLVYHPERVEKEKFVYFAQNSQNGMIKIGASSDPVKRVRGMSTSSASHIVLLGSIPGGFDMEKQIHKIFSVDRVRGEWFHPSPRLARWIGSRIGNVKILVSYDSNTTNKENKDA